MPTSLIIVALVVAWLLVLVPIVARRRQEVARTADSTLAARVVRSGGVRVAVEEEPTMSETGTADTERDHQFDADARQPEELTDQDELDEFSDEFSDDVDDLAERYLEGHRGESSDAYSSSDDFDEEEYSDEAEYFDDEAAEYEDAEYEDAEYGYEPRRSRPYRPGRGGFDPEAAAIAARAKYAFRQRIVLCMLLVAIVTAVVAVVAMPLLWWAHAVVDVTLVGYLTYLRRQVRIEDEIRQRRTARLGTPAAEQPVEAEVEQAPEEEPVYVDEMPARPPVRPPMRPSRPRPGTEVVDADDSDPMFDDLAEPDVLPYRRAVGE